MLKKSIVEKLHSFGFDKVHEKAVMYSMNTPTRTLRDCYKNCSKAKWDAWNYCVSFCGDMNGRHLTISGCNSNCFTVEFVFFYDGAAYLARITRDHNHVTPIKNSDQIDKYFTC